MDVLTRLAATIAARKAEGDAGASHTARLLAKGRGHCARKFGEEAVEAIVAAGEGDRDGLIGEAADVMFHMMVMLAAHDVDFDEVTAELERREGTSGLVEKAARPKDPR